MFSKMAQTKVWIATEGKAFIFTKISCLCAFVSHRGSVCVCVCACVCLCSKNTTCWMLSFKDNRLPNEPNLRREMFKKSAICIVSSSALWSRAPIELNTKSNKIERRKKGLFSFVTVEILHALIVLLFYTLTLLHVCSVLKKYKP